MTFCASFSNESTFSEFRGSDVSALRADIKLCPFRWNGSWERPRGFVVEMSPNFESLKRSGFDPVALFKRLDGDLELLRDLVQIFSEESPLLLQKIDRAIVQGAFEDVRKLSHKLKGSALQFSGSRVASLAASLEDMGAHQTLAGAAPVFSDLRKEVASLEQSLQSMATGEGWTT